MTTYLINHLRIPGDVPNEAGLSYLEQVESTAKAYGGKWLAQGAVQVVEGAWPGSVVLMEFPNMTEAQRWYRSPEYQKILPLRSTMRSAISSWWTVSGPISPWRASRGGSEARSKAQELARLI